MDVIAQMSCDWGLFTTAYYNGFMLVGLYLAFYFNCLLLTKYQQHSVSCRCPRSLSCCTDMIFFARLHQFGGVWSSVLWLSGFRGTLWLQIKGEWKVELSEICVWVFLTLRTAIQQVGIAVSVNRVDCRNVLVGFELCVRSNNATLTQFILANQHVFCTSAIVC